VIVLERLFEGFWCQGGDGVHLDFISGLKAGGRILLLKSVRDRDT